MSFEEDPEVVADLKLRAYSEHDRSRTRGDGVYEWKPPADVTNWMCTRCGTMCGVPEEALHAIEVFDRRLKSQNESPLDRKKIMWCDKCRIVRAEYASRLNRKQVDTLATVIRELKEDPGPSDSRVTELLEKCRELNHPDVDGLALAIKERREKRTSAGSKRVRRGTF